MKKTIFCIAAACALLAAIPAEAKRPRVRYRGEVAVGVSAGYDPGSSELLHLRIVNGIAVGRCFSAGIGVGLDFAPALFAMTSLVPVYLNLKGYLPTKSVRPYVSCDIGAGIGATGFLSGRSGLLCAPALGCAFELGKNDRAIQVSLGFSMQGISGVDGRPDEVNRSVQLLLGYRF